LPPVRIGILGDDFFAGAAYSLERTRDEVAPVADEVERLTLERFIGVGGDPAALQKPKPPFEPLPNGQMSVHEVARATVSDRHAKSVAHVVLRVAGHVDTMASPLGSPVAAR
jgi:hypothetical protein